MKKNGMTRQFGICYGNVIVQQNIYNLLPEHNILSMVYTSWVSKYMLGAEVINEPLY